MIPVLCTRNHTIGRVGRREDEIVIYAVLRSRKPTPPAPEDPLQRLVYRAGEPMRRLGRQATRGIVPSGLVGPFYLDTAGVTFQCRRCGTAHAFTEDELRGALRSGASTLQAQRPQ